MNTIRMFRHRQKRLLVGALAALLVGLIPHPASALPPQITHHDLDVTITPGERAMTARDFVQVLWDPNAGEPFTFGLADTLEVTAVADKDGKPLNWRKTESRDGRQEYAVFLSPTESSPVRVSIEYTGTVADEVEESSDLRFVVGDDTRGIIDERGVYLVRETGWTPTTGDGLATYRVRARVPDGWAVCAQGTMIRESRVQGRRQTEWSSTVPSAGLALVAGKWDVRRRDIGGVTIETYLSPDHAGASQTIAEAAGQFVQTYSELLGPYPFQKFAVVENFFSSGYAFPGFTLLAPRLMARPEQLSHPGYLDHEIVHNWWGNGVLVDHAEGNWAEAVTTYYANYRAEELQGPDAAEAFRRRAQLRYALFAPTGEDYPLKQFLAKETQLDDAVGYAKGAMLFHLMRRAVGDDVFWPTMRELAQAHIGTRLGWSGFIGALESASGASLGWTESWLENVGLPEVAFDQVTVSGTPNGFEIHGAVVQRGDSYDMNLPLTVETVEGPVDTSIPVSGARTAFTLPVNAWPTRMTLDPAADVMRVVPRDAQQPCLNRTLHSPLVVVYPEDGRDARSAIYRRLAERAAEQQGGKAVPASEVTSRLLEGKSIFALGYNGGHPVLDRVFEDTTDVLELGPRGFTLQGERWDGPGASVLATVVRRDDPDTTLTVFAGNSEDALARADYLFYYGWDSVVRFVHGRPVDRSTVHLNDPAAAWDALAASSDEADLQHIRVVIDTLADPWLSGRMTGEPESAQAIAYLKTAFQELGVSPAGSDGFAHTFTIPEYRPAEDIPLVEFITRRGSIEHDAWPAWWSPAAAVEGQITFAGYSWSDAQWDDYRRANVDGRIAVAFAGGPPHVAPEARLDALAVQALNAQNQGAAGLLLIVPEEDRDAFAPAMAVPFAAFPWPAPRSPRAASAERQHPRPALRAARLRSRVEPPDVEITIPVWLMPWNPESEPVVSAMRVLSWWERLQEAKRPYAANVRARLHAEPLYTMSERTGTNIVGMIPGNDPLLRDEIIVLGAHFDHLGLSESGEVFRGADDNASGVSALLSAANMLMERKVQLRRTVVLVAFDGEEWGLLGSDAFLRDDLIDAERIVAMINVDSVGRNIDDKVYVVGETHHEELGAIAKRWSEALGLKVGEPIDRFAYPRGSDHWPFALRGIPAIDLFASDYRAMDSTADVPEAIDVAHVGRIARAVASLTYELATRPPADPAMPAPTAVHEESLPEPLDLPLAP